MMRPTEGTDAARMLDALEAAYPEPAFDLNSRLLITAHSRAADLRKLGYSVEAVRVADASHPKGARFGYRLVLASEGAA